VISKSTSNLDFTRRFFSASKITPTPKLYLSQPKCPPADFAFMASGIRASRYFLLDWKPSVTGSPGPRRRRAESRLRPLIYFGAEPPPTDMRTTRCSISWPITFAARARKNLQMHLSVHISVALLRPALMGLGVGPQARTFGRAPIQPLYVGCSTSRSKQ
jgi:hypothetical protein